VLPVAKATCVASFLPQGSFAPRSREFIRQAFECDIVKLLSQAPLPPNFGGQPLYSPQDWGTGGGYRPAAEAILAACLSSNVSSSISRG